MYYTDIPATVGEIQAQREDTIRHDSFVRDETLSKYRVNDRVEFNVGTHNLQGRITNVNNRGGLFYYHIATDDGVWYRNIDEQLIVNSQWNKK
jgi:hypothetical protein